MNRTLLYADTRDTKLKAIDESIIRRRFRGSQTLFRQAVPLAIQDVLVIILTNAGPEHQIFRIYEGGGIKFVEDFPTNFPNCHWNTKSNTPAKLPSSSLSEGWPT